MFRGGDCESRVGGLFVVFDTFGTIFECWRSEFYRLGMESKQPREVSGSRAKDIFVVLGTFGTVFALYIG